jgi:2-polyprenyl-6-methoxyphenol hydroxylase-like FAD-dependent oxidoreductase
MNSMVKLKMNEMLLENKKIAIIGGGPGGLTLARLLQMKGANVKVYERDYSSEARVQGAIVDLHFGSGLRAIEEAGLLDTFKTHYMPGADRYRILDKHATIRYDEHNESSEISFGDEHFRPEIDRGALRKILLNALEPGTVIWDCQFMSMELVDHEWKLECKNGTTAHADIVIGSDGARSTIRPYVTDIVPRYCGVTIVVGEVDSPETECPAIYELVGMANMSAFGDDKIISIQPRGDGGLTFYVSAKQPESWVKTSGINFTDPAAVNAAFARLFEGWDPLFFTLFKACTHFTPRPLHCIPLDQTWEAKPNITLIGDAAHIMPPSGEGVNLAMLDAVELCECLTSHDFDDLQTAIAAYEKSMRARAAKEAGDALEMREWMHTEGAMEKMIELIRPK